MPVQVPKIFMKRQLLMRERTLSLKGKKGQGIAIDH